MQSHPALSCGVLGAGGLRVPWQTSEHARAGVCRAGEVFEGGRPDAPFSAGQSTTALSRSKRAPFRVSAGRPEVPFGTGQGHRVLTSGQPTWKTQCFLHADPNGPLPSCRPHTPWFPRRASQGGRAARVGARVPAPQPTLLSAQVTLQRGPTYPQLPAHRQVGEGQLSPLSAASKGTGTRALGTRPGVRGGAAQLGCEAAGAAACFGGRG